MAYIKHFVKGPKFVIKSSLEFVDVRDVALAHVNALDLGDDGQRYILHAHRMWMQVGELLQKARPRKEVGKARHTQTNCICFCHISSKIDC